MRKSIVISALLGVIFSCNSPQTHTEREAHVTPVYEELVVDCSWGDSLLYDTVLYENSRFVFKIRCKRDVNYTDTIEAERDTFYIRKWNTLEYVVHSELFRKELIITKASYMDSLAADLRNNGFLTPPYDFVFNAADSSVKFSTFIGHADSDVGDIYEMKIDKDGSTMVTAVITPEMGE